MARQWSWVWPVCQVWQILYRDFMETQCLEYGRQLADTMIPILLEYQKVLTKYINRFVNVYQPKKLIRIRNRIIEQSRTVIHVQRPNNRNINYNKHEEILYNTLFKFFNSNVDNLKRLYQLSMPTSPMEYQPNRFNTDDRRQERPYSRPWMETNQANWFISLYGTTSIQVAGGRKPIREQVRQPIRCDIVLF